MAIRTLPQLTPGSDFYGTMKAWQQSLRPLLAVKNPPAQVMSLAVTGGTGGNQLTWSPQAGVDGFVIQRADSPNFSGAVDEIPIPSGQQNAYFDSQASGITKYYRIIATAGTVNNPQQMRGVVSGIVAGTVGSGTAAYDTTSRGTPAPPPTSTLFPIRPRITQGLITGRVNPPGSGGANQP